MFRIEFYLVDQWKTGHKEKYKKVKQLLEQNGETRTRKYQLKIVP